MALLNKQKAVEELELELKNFNEKLSNEVKQRTHELELEITERKRIDSELKKALKRAEDANYLKNAFLSNMSHEIRTPLNGIIGFASLLETELSLLEEEELYDYAHGISQSGERLLHLLNNIIDISRIEANDLKVETVPCTIDKILRECAELYLFKANEKGLQFNLKAADTQLVALADEASLAKIISDVIDNAVKYTERGYINISAGIANDPYKIYIKIKDTGIGIDSAYLPNIFDAFRQESLGYTRAYQGAGLGLPLAKRLIMLMKGDVDVESVKGLGTTVTLYLPKYDPKKVPVTKPDGEVVTEDTLTSKPKPVMFVVEDDRMNRMVLKKMIEPKWEVVLAKDGDETLATIGNSYEQGIIFDIMLFDINLPAPWDGVNLMYEVKKRWKEYRNVPFIAQTAYAMSGDRERLLDSGFDDYISKPIRHGKLITTITNHLQKRRV